MSAELTIFTGSSGERGLATTQSYTALSGFVYTSGVRDCKYFKIEESVADGVGISYLCSLRIFQEDRIVSERQFRDVRYTRQEVHRLCGEMLYEAFTDMMKRENVVLDRPTIQARIREILDHAYYHRTDQALMQLAKEWGALKS